MWEFTKSWKNADGQVEWWTVTLGEIGVLGTLWVECVGTLGMLSVWGHKRRWEFFRALGYVEMCVDTREGKVCGHKSRWSLWTLGGGMCVDTTGDGVCVDTTGDGV